MPGTPGSVASLLQCCQVEFDELLRPCSPTEKKSKGFRSGERGATWIQTYLKLTYPGASSPANRVPILKCELELHFAWRWSSGNLQIFRKSFIQFINIYLFRYSHAGPVSGSSKKCEQVIVVEVNPHQTVTFCGVKENSSLNLWFWVAPFTIVLFIWRDFQINMGLIGKKLSSLDYLSISSHSLSSWDIWGL